MRLLYTMIVSVFLLAANPKKKPQRKIIDVHFHAHLSTDYGKTPPPNPITGKIPKWKNDKDVIDQMLATLKANNVVKVIACGSLATIKEFQLADPERIIPAIDYPDSQNNPLPDTTSFIRYFLEKKFYVFGELALQYEGKTLADPELDPYLAICERIGIPVAVHTGMGPPNTPYNCCPKFRAHLGNPLLIEEVLIKYPKMKIQLMHLGFPWLQETKAILNVYPQVYADIGAINWLRPVADFYSYFKSLVDAGYGKRIMYGSDQMAWEDAIPLSIKNVENATFLSEEQKHDIFYNNAARFYNIK
jgi:hypothetical protein